MLVEVNIQLWHGLVQICLIFLEGHFVASLVLTIVFSLLLDGIVCQMYKFVEALQVEVLARGPEIAVQVAVALENAIY